MEGMIKEKEKGVRGERRERKNREEWNKGKDL